MKPFNLEEAKAGKPVCTRDGKRVEIISFTNSSSIYPILARVFHIISITLIFIITKKDTSFMIIENLKQI